MSIEEEIHAMRVLLDRQQIHDLLLQYFCNVDRRRFEPVKAVFVPGAALDYSALMPIGDAVPAEEVVDRIEEAIGIYEVTVHEMGNHQCEVMGDKAESETWVTAHHVYADPERQGGRLPLAGLRYQDWWVRTPDGWRIEARRAFTDWRGWLERREPTYVGGLHQ
jgi:hypothetical protein